MTLEDALTLLAGQSPVGAVILFSVMKARSWAQRIDLELARLTSEVYALRRPAPRARKRKPKARRVPNGSVHADG